MQVANTQYVNALETSCVNKTQLSHPLKIRYTTRLPTASSFFLLSFYGSNNVHSVKSISMGLTDS